MKVKYLLSLIIGIALVTSPLFAFQGTEYEIDIKYLDLELEVSDTSTYLKGRASITFSFVQPGQTTLKLLFTDKLDILEMISETSGSLTYNQVDNVLTINGFDGDGDLKHVSIAYEGLPEDAEWIDGVFNRLDNETNTRVTYTLSEPFSAHKWYPLQEILTDKIDSAQITLITEKSNLAGSAGILVDNSEVDANRHRFVWKTNYPTTYYLFSYCVGEFRAYNFYAPLPDGDSVFVQNFIYDDDKYLQKYEDDILATKDMMYSFSELFGKYPFHLEKYGHCTAPMRGGAMEHQTMTTTTNFNFRLVAHELAHQWFGNYVTCGSWQEIWINEGFASYLEIIALEELKSKAEANSALNIMKSYILLGSGGSIYVPDEDSLNEGRIFDYRLTYLKGAWLVHMIRGWINNDDLFYEILREFLDENKNGFAVADDLIAVINRKTGNDITDFFYSWYLNEGYPTFTVQWKQYNDNLHIMVSQTPSSPQTEYFNVYLDFEINGKKGDKTIRKNMASVQEEFVIPIEGMVQNVNFDPENWILKMVSENSNTDASPLPKIDIYPVPADNEINIFLPIFQENLKIKLFDMAGNRVLKTEASGFSCSLPVENLAAGAYVLELNGKGIDSITKKIIIE